MSAQDWSSYPGEGYWNYDNTAGGWTAEIMDLGDPAFSMGMSDHRFSWRVSNWEGREKATGHTDHLREAYQLAELAYAMES